MTACFTRLGPRLCSSSPRERVERRARAVLCWYWGVGGQGGELVQQ